MEIWRSVVGYEGLYEVSDCGRVRSVRKQRIMRPFIDNLGRKRIQLSNNGKVKAVFVHQLVAQAFPEICGEWFEGCVVDHLDTDMSNNNPNNLRVCTQYDNIHNPISEKRRFDAVVEATGKPINAKKNGVVVHSFPSVMQAAQYFGVSDWAIRNALRGYAKTSCGFTWELSES